MSTHPSAQPARDCEHDWRYPPDDYDEAGLADDADSVCEHGLIGPCHECEGGAQ